jgi:hypothetical protein
MMMMMLMLMRKCTVGSHVLHFSTSSSVRATAFRAAQGQWQHCISGSWEATQLHGGVVYGSHAQASTADQQMQQVPALGPWGTCLTVAFAVT